MNMPRCGKRWRNAPEEKKAGPRKRRGEHPRKALTDAGYGLVSLAAARARALADRKPARGGGDREKAAVGLGRRACRRWRRRRRAADIYSGRGGGAATRRGVARVSGIPW